MFAFFATALVLLVLIVGVRAYVLDERAKKQRQRGEDSWASQARAGSAPESRMRGPAPVEVDRS